MPQSKKIHSGNLNVTHAHLRRDYQSDFFSEKKVAGHPMRQFGLWFDEAVKKKVPDGNAFVLATSGKNQPSARVLLMKASSNEGITFFTNYTSEKGKQITMNPHAEAVFFWGALNRQVRLRGKLSKLSRKESETYFRSRPLEAQLAACASQQSAPVQSRLLLEDKYLRLQKQYQNELPPMPENWGGYLLKVSQVEFWQGRPSRFHDRLLYKKSARGFWKITRLQP
ncbi:MAG TPA: pyridoxamine 5'-phosphate oxidase [Candidatus Omnitrophota bacterium]|nr:pyridoxamine 5'-phosphate oxidase [Candidatus Omnitrophota bacterium]